MENPIEAAAERAIHGAESAFDRALRRPRFGNLAERAAQAQQDQPSPSPQPEVPPMSFGQELHRIAAVAEAFGEDAAKIFEAVASNPEAKAGVLLLARMAGLPIGAGTISAGLAGLGAIETVWHTGQQAAAQPQATFTPAADGQGQPQPGNL